MLKQWSLIPATNFPCGAFLGYISYSVHWHALTMILFSNWAKIILDSCSGQLTLFYPHQPDYRKSRDLDTQPRNCLTLSGPSPPLPILPASLIISCILLPLGGRNVTQNEALHTQTPGWVISVRVHVVKFEFITSHCPNVCLALF